MGYKKEIYKEKMKAEIINYPGKGLCILISDINPYEFLTEVVGSTVFSDVNTIAELIEADQKIAAIKEVRHQTGWGLKEAKEYVDSYMPTHNRDSLQCGYKFRKDHTLLSSSFLKNDDFEV